MALALGISRARGTSEGLSTQSKEEIRQMVKALNTAKDTLSWVANEAPEYAPQLRRLGTLLTEEFKAAKQEGDRAALSQARNRAADFSIDTQDIFIDDIHKEMRTLNNEIRDILKVPKGSEIKNVLDLLHEIEQYRSKFDRATSRAVIDRAIYKIGQTFTRAKSHGQQFNTATQKLDDVNFDDLHEELVHFEEKVALINAYDRALDKGRGKGGNAVRDYLNSLSDDPQHINFMGRGALNLGGIRTTPAGEATRGGIYGTPSILTEVSANAITDHIQDEANEIKNLLDDIAQDARQGRDFRSKIGEANKRNVHLFAIAHALEGYLTEDQQKLVNHILSGPDTADGRGTLIRSVNSKFHEVQEVLKNHGYNYNVSSKAVRDVVRSEEYQNALRDAESVEHLLELFQDRLARRLRDLGIDVDAHAAKIMELKSARRDGEAAPLAGRYVDIGHPVELVEEEGGVDAHEGPRVIITPPPVDTTPSNPHHASAPPNPASQVSAPPIDTRSPKDKIRSALDLGGDTLSIDEVDVVLVQDPEVIRRIYLDATKTAPGIRGIPGGIEGVQGGIRQEDKDFKTFVLLANNPNTSRDILNKVHKEAGMNIRYGSDLYGNPVTLWDGLVGHENASKALLQSLANQRADRYISEFAQYRLDNDLYNP